MGAIRHKSVRPETKVLLSIEGTHLSAQQPVEVLAKSFGKVIVKHANGWVRTLEAPNGDARVYRDPACKDPAITFRLLPIAEEAAA